MINIQVVKCGHCSSVITSRANHDFNSCQCGHLSVDGGNFNEDTNTQVISRVVGSFQREDVSVLEDFPLTPDELFEDWNKSVNKYKDLRKYV